jgi:hypothetical protein
MLGSKQARVRANGGAMGAHLGELGARRRHMRAIMANWAATPSALHAKPQVRKPEAGLRGVRNRRRPREHKSKRGETRLGLAPSALGR